jgi:hypothetical protein
VSARSLFGVLGLDTLLGIGTLVAISMALSSCSEPAAQASDQSEAVLQLEIAVNRQALSESRVQIDATLTNGLAYSISFSPWNTPFSSQITGRVFKVEKRVNGLKLGGGDVAGDYSLVPYTGIMLKRGPPSTQDYLTLKPGQQIHNSLDITAVYGFTENSQLRVTYDRPINIGNNKFRSLTSNTINFYY